MLTSLTYAVDHAKRRSGEEMDTVYIHAIRKPGGWIYDVSFSPSCLILEEGETAEVRAVYHNGKCVQWND